VNELIICAQVNEGMQREPNPHVPFTPEEIAEVAAASRAAGASVIHMHARTPDGGMDDTAAGYAKVLRAIRARTDILTAPPLLNLPGASDDERLEVILSSEPDDLPDFVVVETGSTNFDLADPHTGDFATDGRLFVTTTSSQVRFLHEAALRNLPVLAATFGGSWSRAIDIHRHVGRLPSRSLVLLVHGGPEFPAAPPATVKGLLAHLDQLPDAENIDWMVSAHRGDVLDLAEEAIVRGGHVAIGVGDYAHPGATGYPSTPELVAEVAALGRKHGRPPATPNQVREWFRRTPAETQE